MFCCYEEQKSRDTSHKWISDVMLQLTSVATSAFALPHPSRSNVRYRSDAGGHLLDLQMGSLTVIPLKTVRGGGILMLPSLLPTADLHKHKAWLDYYLAKAELTQGVSKNLSTNHGELDCSMFKMLCLD